MSYSEILEQSDDLRVSIVLDEYPDAPYDDGGSPILQSSYHGRNGWTAEQVTNGTSYTVHPRLVEALERFGSGKHRELFERYARAFHGATALQWEGPYGGDYTYVTLDPSTWREETGAPVGSVDMSEWLAYCAGEVYGFVVERRVVWAPTNVPADDDVTMETWETVDSCFGFYGDTEYLRSEALESYRLATA